MNAGTNSTVINETITIIRSIIRIDLGITALPITQIVNFSYVSLLKGVMFATKIMIADFNIGKVFIKLGFVLFAEPFIEMNQN